VSVVNKMAKVPVIDIRPADLETVREILRRHVPGYEVLAFGSRVRWTARDYSDLDLAIRSDKPIPSKIISAIKEELSESNLPMRVDVLDMASVDEKFRRIIEEEYAVVQRREDRSFVHFGKAVEINPKVQLEHGDVYPYVDMKQIDPNLPSVSATESKRYKGSGSRFQPGDTLMARITPCLENGKIAQFASDNQPGHGSTEFIVIRGKEGVTDNDFAYYLTRSPKVRSFAVAQMTGSSGRQRVPINSLSKLEVLLPPLAEQKKIARILGTLDDKIELNRRMNKTLEAMARAIFKSWFVDFDPVHAKAEGRDTGLPARIDNLFPDEFEESELGNIPKGWEVKPLDAIADFLNGLALQKFPPKVGEADLPVIKITELRNGVTAKSERASANIPEQYIIEDGDVLFSWSGSLLQRIWTSGPGALNQHLFKVSSPQYPKWFHYFWVDKHLAGFQAIAAGKATTMGHIQRHHLSEVQAIVPDAHLLKAADAHMAPLFTKIVTTAQADCALVTLRDTLLPNLLSGRVSEESN